MSDEPLIRFVNDKILFQATSLKATFRDGAHYDYKILTSSIHYNSTVIGDVLTFSLHTATNETHKKRRRRRRRRRQVRLYFIPPELDWHKNETYRWKLNQAWMSDDYYGWIFWNVNGFINSQLQLSFNSQVFQCDHVEFEFWNNAPRGRFSIGGNAQGRVVLENVKMAALLPHSVHKDSLTIYNPCNETCRIVNGSVTCGNGTTWKYGATLVSFLVAVIVVTVFRRTRSETSRRYDRVAHGESTTERDVYISDDEDSNHEDQQS